MKSTRRLAERLEDRALRQPFTRRGESRSRYQLRLARLLEQMSRHPSG